MLCETGIHNQCTHCTGKEGCCKPDPVTWSRENWCCLLRVIFAIIGVGVPLYMYMRPCESKLEIYESFFTDTMYYNVSERQPVDLYFVIDGSTSMTDQDWSNQLRSTQIFMQTFNESIPDVRIGLGIFSSAHDQSQFVSDISDDKSIIDSVLSLQQPGGGTQYDIAMQMFQLQVLLHGRNDGQTVHNPSSTFADHDTNQHCINAGNVLYSEGFPTKDYAWSNDCEWEILESGFLIIHSYFLGNSNSNVESFFLNNNLIPNSGDIEQVRVEVNAGDIFKFNGQYSHRGFVAHIEKPFHIAPGTAKSIMVFISDGLPSQIQFQSKFLDLTKTLKLRHEVIGIMISDLFSAFDLCRVSSCYETTGCLNGIACEGGGDTCVGEANCPYFIQEPDFTTFRDEAQEVAQMLVDTVPIIKNSTVVQNTTAFNQIEESCVFAPWLGFLGLLLPLILLLFVGWSVDSKKKIIVKKQPAPKKTLKPPSPPPQVEKREPKQPTSENVNIPGKPGGKRYKWKIQASDQYLWNMSGGTAPMKVHFGEKAPPSAPKDMTKPVKKVLVESWEGEDGYTYEKLEVDATLEEWAEEKIIEIVKTPLFEWLCCCCLCKACCMICRPLCCKWCCFVKDLGEEVEETEYNVTISTAENPSSPRQGAGSPRSRGPPPPPPSLNMPATWPQLANRPSTPDPQYDMGHLWGRQSHELSTSADYADGV